eukprot:TRINITY_DN39197_c0_g1_i1.p1 TRINITY_DN39197_c0_g1~~TRINITY_DN39197_c0_g1_i1.p1  ORF type:complete len:234 (+),score=54.45 TRINITY_DN39197_c0_g1_i1:60-761(+)
MSGRILIGLRNPGQRYVNTMHNAGHWLCTWVLDQARSAAGGQVQSHAMGRNGHTVSLLTPEVLTAVAERHSRAQRLITNVGDFKALSFQRLYIVEPNCYMNNSQDAVHAVVPPLLLNESRLDWGERLCVAYDEMDLAPASVKWRAPKRGGRKQKHNGVSSVDGAVSLLSKRHGGAEAGCHKIRLGVGSSSNPVSPMVNHERDALLGMFPQVMEALLLFAAGSVPSRVMSVANA